MEIPQENITLKSITLTKTEAAIRQIDASIEALLHDRFDVAITLAGAAEDMIDSSRSLIDYQRKHSKVRELDMTGKEYVDRLNRERNWLKHPSGPDTMEPDLI